jgi:hypothetical protein
MSFCAAWFFVLGGICTMPAGSGPEPAYTQHYSILLKGSPSGSERVTETTEKDGTLVAVSEHEILISDGIEVKRMAFTTTMRMAKGDFALLHYSYRYTAGDSLDSLEVDVKDGQIQRALNRGGRTSEVTVPLQPGLVILDFSVYHQYDYLVRKYDSKKRGRQSFANFIPLIGSVIPVSLTLLGESKFDYPGGSLRVRNFSIEVLDIWTGTFAVDDSGRLVRLVAPGQDLEVVRTDLLPSK